MNHPLFKRRILMLLKETDVSFKMVIDAGGHPNMDYAEYAADTRIDCFRSALQNPELSRAQLAAMLRRADKQRGSAKAENTYWSAFMAYYLSRNANSNITT